MSDKVKIALIAAGALILAVWLYVYNTPYQTCVRAAVSSRTATKEYAQVRCAINSN